MVDNFQKTLNITDVETGLMLGSQEKQMKDLATCISLFEAILRQKDSPPWEVYERACRCCVELLAMKSVAARYPELLSSVGGGTIPRGMALSSSSFSCRIVTHPPCVA